LPDILELQPNHKIKLKNYIIDDVEHLVGPYFAFKAFKIEDPLGLGIFCIAKCMA